MRSKKLGEIARAKDQICKHLEAGQEVNAMIWAENLIQDEGMIPVYDVLSSYCDQLMGRCTYMEKFGVPKDMNQCFATVLYSSPRLECKELEVVRKQFTLLLDKQFIKEVDAEGSFVHPVVKANIDIYIKEQGAVCHRLV